MVVVVKQHVVAVAISSGYVNSSGGS
jgi:stage V sporulation protein SpoVS